MSSKRLFVLVAALIGILMTSAIAADSRDSVDRSQRLDTDALRDDMSTNRLQIPSHPLPLQATPQTAPSVKRKSKSRTTSGCFR